MLLNVSKGNSGVRRHREEAEDKSCVSNIWRNVRRKRFVIPSESFRYIIWNIASAPAHTTKLSLLTLSRDRRKHLPSLLEARAGPDCFGKRISLHNLILQ